MVVDTLLKHFGQIFLDLKVLPCLIAWSTFHDTPLSDSLGTYLRTLFYILHMTSTISAANRFTMDSAEVPEAQTQNKRKATTAGLPGVSRLVKRRAPKACCCCRARKVRCDVVDNGAPCTNCRL